MDKDNKAILPIYCSYLLGSPNHHWGHGRNLRNIMIRHASLPCGVIRTEHVGVAQDDEGGRELGSLRNLNE